MKQTVSEKQFLANFLNSQLSTGPRSSAAKKKVSMNAIKHGYCGQTVVVLEHERDAYNNHFKSFRDEYKPVGPTEEYLVETLANHSWSTTRIRALVDDRITLSAIRHASPD